MGRTCGLVPDVSGVGVLFEGECVTEEVKSICLCIIKNKVVCEGSHKMFVKTNSYTNNTQ
ncbi:hypothetical protein Bwad005_05960 [Bilophila wadsworthia]